MINFIKKNTDDKNIHCYFSIVNNSIIFRQSDGEDLIDSNNAVKARVILTKPNNVEVASSIADIEDGKIHLLVTEDLIDEDTELGVFNILFDLYDDEGGILTVY